MKKPDFTIESPRREPTENRPATSAALDLRTLRERSGAAGDSGRNLRELLKSEGVEPAAVADQLDEAVTSILRALRSGHDAHLPGIGTISPGKRWTFHPESHER